MLNGIIKYNGVNIYIKPYVALRCSHKKAYFFDGDMIWTAKPIDDACTNGIKEVGKRSLRDGGNYYWLGRAINTCLSDGETNATNGNLNRKIIARLKVGDHVSKINELAETTTIEEHEPVNYSELERFVNRVDAPVIYREPENTNEKTFDYVECTVWLSSYRDDVVDFFKENREAIDQMVVDKIANDKSFKKYGIPVNCLKLENLGISKRNFARYVFGVKTA